MRALADNKKMKIIFVARILSYWKEQSLIYIFRYWQKIISTVFQWVNYFHFLVAYQGMSINIKDLPALSTWFGGIVVMTLGWHEHYCEFESRWGPNTFFSWETYTRHVNIFSSTASASEAVEDKKNDVVFQRWKRKEKVLNGIRTHGHLHGKPVS